MISRSNTASSPRKLAKNFRLLGLSKFLNCLRIYNSITILFFVSITGSFTLGMSVYACATLAATLMEIPTGLLSDRWNRKNLVIFSTCADFLAVLLYTLAPTDFWLHGLPCLYIGAFCRGTATAATSGNNHAMLYDTSRSVRRTTHIAHILGKNTSMEQIGLAISGLIAGVLLWLGADFHMLVALTLVPYALNIVIASLLIEPPQPKQGPHEASATSWGHIKDSARLLMGNHRLAILALCSSWKSGLGVTSYFFIPKLIEQVWPLWAVPFFRFAQNGTGAFSYWISGKISRLFGPFKVLLYGSLISETVAILAFALFNLFSPLLILLTQVTWAFGNTANNTLQQENFSARQRSTMGSLISFMGSLVAAASALVIGALADLFGVQIALIVTSVLALPTLFGYLHLYKKSAGA